ncbi:MAG: hypothetical protein M3680_17995, partial [Myxococcota bacterium]|nr:hypothetical protein [Myxococcota bacterium]
MPRLATPTPPQLRLRLRTKLVVAMLFAALVPVVIVALLATGVILSSLEGGLREDADRQLTVGLNLVLRSVERLGDECVQLSESAELATAIARRDLAAVESWLSHEAAHVPSARLQLIDDDSQIVLDRTIGGAVTRFVGVGVTSDDPAITAGRAWTRGVSLVTIDDRVIVRAMSPIVDASLTLRGVVVLSMPLDGDFADSIKGALSADVMLGGPSGQLAVTFRSALGRRGEAVTLGPRDRANVLRGHRLIRDLDLDRGGDTVGHYKLAATALFDSKDQPVGVIGVAVDREPLAATKRLAVRTLVGGGLAALAFALLLAQLRLVDAAGD